MKPTRLSLLAIFAAVLLAGCASSHSTSEQALQDAHAAFQQVREDADVLRSAPKDLIRAGESLAKADRLSNYWAAPMMSATMLSQPAVQCGCRAEERA